MKPISFCNRLETLLKKDKRIGWFRITIKEKIMTITCCSDSYQAVNEIFQDIDKSLEFAFIKMKGLLETITIKTIKF